MKTDIIKGILVGLGCILLTVAIGTGIGFACSGDYEGTVDPPEGYEEEASLSEGTWASTLRS